MRLGDLNLVTLAVCLRVLVNAVLDALRHTLRVLVVHERARVRERAELRPSAAVAAVASRTESRSMKSGVAVAVTRAEQTEVSFLVVVVVVVLRGDRPFTHDASVLLATIMATPTRLRAQPPHRFLLRVLVDRREVVEVGRLRGR